MNALRSTAKKNPRLSGWQAARVMNYQESIVMEWKDQYKHPLWQKKRLEVLDSANYQCERCFDDESQLHVHHKHYIKGRKIWEYESSELVALCSSCHEQIHAEKDLLGQIAMAVCPEGYGEIIELVASFCSEVSGPASVDIGFDFSKSSQYSVLLGSIAAKLSNLGIGINGLVLIADKIDMALLGEEATIVLQPKKQICSKSFLESIESKNG